jgi:hypothetical protein
MITREVALYETWYDFKHELQRRSGVVLLNKVWFQIKPRAPLPWNESQMKEAMRYLSGRIIRLRTCPRCSGNLILDRDTDGFYKRCIQCSFEIEIVQKARVPQSKNEERQNNPRLGTNQKTSAVSV